MPETKPTSTAGFQLDPQTVNMLSWILGGGAQAIMGEHQQTWQAGFGKMAQESARSQQFGELLKQLLAGGGKISADQGGTTLKIPTAGGTEAPAQSTQAGPPGQERQPQENAGLLGFLLANQ